MAPKRTTKSSPATTTTTTTSVTDSQLKALIDQGVARSLATHDADRCTNGDDNHVSGTGARRTERVTLGTHSTGSGKLYCQWELSSSSGNALCILFPTCIIQKKMAPKRTTKSSPATTTTITTSVTDSQLKALIDQGVARALAASDADRNMNDDDNHVSGTGARRTKRVTRECTYPEFMKCKPLNFKGTERVVELTQSVEKMETVFRISNCSVKNQIKFSTCTLLGKEVDKIEIYVGGLPDVIHRSVVASRPKTMQEAIEMENELMDKRNNTWAERQAETKRKDDNKNQAQQQPLKKQGVAIAYTARPGERKESPTATNNHRNPTCYEFGNQGHYKSDCLKLKNEDHGNQAGGTGAHGIVHALGGETHQDLNDVEDDINAQTLFL
uniref:Reverse transcriptase domain-containing protein n=1 Tax=Tanacetum cinerariifolium TaxID=118510 RepID=A0A6L2LFA3_TANCI|nr:hypothetical protein [Tanacetum cinerariifolium]